MRQTVLALVLLLLAAGGAGARRAGPAPVSAEALLAADVPWPTVQTVAGHNWWPEPPGFDTTVYQDDPMPRAALTQAYAELGGDGRIVTTLYAYGSRADSGYFLSNATLVGETIDRDRPTVGEAHAFYRTLLPDRTHATRFYFARGPVAVSVQVNADWSRADVERLARPIDERLQTLLAGRLQPPAIPASALARLPSPAAAPGPVLGTASVPAEVWAASVRKGNRLALRDTLVKTGNRTLLFRRYLRRGSRTEVLETTLLAFPGAAAAAAWVAPFRAGVERSPKTKLDPGATGARSAFRLQFSNYELQFAAGRFVGDVFCWAPFAGEPTTACEAATRRLAERWYRQLEG